MNSFRLAWRSPRWAIGRLHSSYLDFPRVWSTVSLSFPARETEGTRTEPIYQWNMTLTWEKEVSERFINLARDIKLTWNHKNGVVKILFWQFFVLLSEILMEIILSHWEFLRSLSLLPSVQISCNIVVICFVRKSNKYKSIL